MAGMSSTASPASTGRAPPTAPAKERNRLGPSPRPEWPECREHPWACAATTVVDAPLASIEAGMDTRCRKKGSGAAWPERSGGAASLRLAAGKNRLGFFPGNEMRPAVAVYNSPVLPNEPSSRRPVQPLRARPSSPAEPVALRQPTPQPFRAGPRSLAAPEWRPCGLLAGNPLESFPSPTGFLTGRERSVETGPWNPQSGTSVQEQAFDAG